MYCTLLKPKIHRVAMAYATGGERGAGIITVQAASHASVVA